ncbi:MAG: hypothetical protein MRK01_11355 [Candidatus Scalindua sp.]|nr:hypothetical protein [Candidatus Scalindua sp.]
MKSLLKHHYATVIDGIKIRLAPLQPFRAKIQKTVSLCLLRLVIVMVMVMIVLWLVKSTWFYFTNQWIFFVSPATFTFNSPNWVTDSLIEKMRNIEGLETRYNIFEKDLTKKIGEVYGESPLISQVFSIKRRLPNTIEIRLELRRPIAVVKSKSREYLIDRDGVRLLDNLYKYPEKEGRPIYIRDNRRLRVPEYGEEWEMNSVRVGLNLLNYLRHNKIDTLLKIATIDVSHVVEKISNRGRSNIILWTEKGTMIKWGSPPSSRQLMELSNYEKLQNLLSVANEEGTDLSNLEYVDVRWKTPVGKRIDIQ